jgi:hypothetical protein
MKTMEAKVTAVISPSSTPGKFSVEMDLIRNVAPSEEFPLPRTYVAATVTSAPLFTSPEDAWAAGRRAVELFNETEKFPNMCEPF